ncbi:hypothetical protein YPPY19_2449, partial [Yersinia pestis PY-19]
MKRPYPP